jgi:hypothetical protein
VTASRWERDAIQVLGANQPDLAVTLLDVLCEDISIIHLRIVDPDVLNQFHGLHRSVRSATFRKPRICGNAACERPSRSAAVMHG